VIERRDAVLVIRINRPEKRNALNGPVMAGTGKGITVADSTPDNRATVLTGTGDRSFCAGMDLAASAGGGLAPSAEDQQYMGTFMNFMSKGECETPVIGAAQATALAGGFELLMACDLTVASRGRAGRPSRGEAGAVRGRRRHVPVPAHPPAEALELTLTGDPIDATEAVRLGLINKAVPADKVLDEAIALAERVAANGSLGVQATKKLMRMAAFEPAADVLVKLGALATICRRRRAQFRDRRGRHGP